MVLLLLMILLGDLFMNMTEILAEEKVFINATINSDVQLICPANETEIYPTWFKRLGDNASDCNLATGNRINKDDPLSTRMKLEGFTKGFYNLMIANITINDTGLYCCTTVNDLTPTEFCTQLYIPDNTKIEIKQRNNALECLIAGIKTNSSFSWTHYSQHGNHLHCHDRIGSVLNLSEYKPFEREGLYTCTATFHGGTNDVILQTSVRVTDEGKPSCFLENSTSFWKKCPTSHITFLVFSSPAVIFRWTRANDTVVDITSIRKKRHPVYICNMSVNINVEEYNLQTNDCILKDHEIMVTLYINNSIGESFCYQTFQNSNDSTEGSTQVTTEPFRETFKYLVGCGGFVICITITAASCFFCGRYKGQNRINTHNQRSTNTTTDIELTHVYHTIQDHEFLNREHNESEMSAERLSLASSNRSISQSSNVVCVRSYTSLVEVPPSAQHDYENPSEDTFIKDKDIIHQNMGSLGFKFEKPYMNLYFETKVQKVENENCPSNTQKSKQDMKTDAKYVNHAACSSCDIEIDGILLD